MSVKLSGMISPIHSIDHPDNRSNLWSCWPLALTKVSQVQVSTSSPTRPG